MERLSFSPNVEYTPLSVFSIRGFKLWGVLGVVTLSEGWLKAQLVVLVSAGLYVDLRYRLEDDDSDDDKDEDNDT